MSSEEELRRFETLLGLYPEKREKIKEAFELAKERHGEQKRKTGEPFYLHPLRVALLLAELGADADTVIAGLLHDVLEDTDAKPEEIEERFGKAVLKLVEGVTKIGKIKYTSQQAQNYMKLMLATAEDPRVILLKLADRLDNLKSLWVFREDKRKRIAKETLEVYAPLAHCFGVWKLKTQLEDYAFKYLYPNEYERVKAYVASFGKELESYLKKLVIPRVKKALEEAGIEAEIQYRRKHYYSIWEKTKRKGIRLEEVHDVLGVRVIVDEKPQCYAVLGIIHDLFKPVPGKFKDYVSLPKANMYQSLHTTVVADKGKLVEFQIRTKEMHERAEKGIAAHWAYKGAVKEEDRGLFSRFRELIEDLLTSPNPSEIVENLKAELVPEEVVVFTPKGDIVVLPKGSTPVDFAYKIHTEVGHHCAGAKVNGRLVPLNYRLKNGDMVEIITHPNKTPSLDWLNFVKTSRARNRIRQFFKKLEKERYLAEGRRRLEKLAQRLGLSAEELLKRIREKVRFEKEEELLTALGKRQELEKRLLKFLLPKQKPKREEREADGLVSFGSLEGIKYERARCCRPVPGDEVFGVVARGRGLLLHEAGCPNLKNVLKVSPDRVKRVELKGKGEFTTGIRVVAKDRRGLLSEVASAISSCGANIRKSSTRTHGGYALLDFDVDVKDREHLLKLCSKIKELEEVEACERLYS